jgi:hypothetical protein
MDLDILAGRGRRSKLGDVFELRVHNDIRILSLVVGADLMDLAPMPGAALIYVFKPTRWSSDLLPAGSLHADASAWQSG